MMEIANVYTAQGEPLPGGGEHKTVLKSGDRLRCLYYKVPYRPEKDAMDGVHPHPVEGVIFVIDGEVEVNVAGESTILKKGDAMLVPVDAVMGTKVLSSMSAETFIVTTLPNTSHESHKTEE
ncbi:MAG TPA: cupin domain-containing protein [Dehalococcoidia bacterium]|nr:cupin domain-containing protein [Dehalococcoidia bacterium]